MIPVTAINRALIAYEIEVHKAYEAHTNAVIEATRLFDQEKRDSYGRLDRRMKAAREALRKNLEDANDGSTQPDPTP